MLDSWQSALVGRRVAVWLAALTAALFCCSLQAGTASAASYSVYACTGPSGESLTNGSWFQGRSVSSHASAFSFGSSCPDLSTTLTAGSTLAAFEDAGYFFDAPAGTSISGYDIRRSVNVEFPALGALPTLSAGLRRTSSTGETYWGECDAKSTNCVIPASGTQSIAPAGSVGIAASSLQVGIECAQPLSCLSSLVSSLRTTLVKARVDLTDNIAPTVTASGGTLAGASASSGTRWLTVASNDKGGGVRSHALSIDGVPVSSGNAGGNCVEPYTLKVPCPIELNANYVVDLASYGPGTHTAIASAIDAAGNVGTLAPILFTIPGALSANGTPSVEFPALKTSKSAIAVKSSKAVAVRGVLRTSAGDAIGGATLEVTTSSLGGSSEVPLRTGSVKTAGDGSFVYKVKPNGALRITFVFRPSSGAAGTATASTTLRQAISLSARRSQAKLRRGSSLAISGRLSGAGRAAAGVPVEIQVKNGKRWITIDTVTAGKSGSYKWKYRFKRVTRPTLFTFRAIVRSKQAWPWPSKSSSSVQVLVLG